jgi:hypothetical protein
MILERFDSNSGMWPEDGLRLSDPFALLRPELDEGSLSKGKDWKGQECLYLE